MKYLAKNLVLLFIICSVLWSCQPGSKETDSSNSTVREKQASRVTSFDQWFSNPIPLVSAHRGGPYPGYPENAIETFEYIYSQTSTVIECDIVMTSDSVLVLLHDDTLNRTTNGDGSVADFSYDELQLLRLVDNDGVLTPYTIPNLDEVLAWGRGKVLFTLDVKRGVPFEKVVQTIEKHDAASYAAIITYRISDAKLIHSLNKNINISVSAGSKEALDQIVKSKIPVEKLLGFVGIREPDQAHYQAVKKLGLKTILGTLGNLDKKAEARGNDNVYLTYIENGANIVATDRPLELATVLNSK